MGRRNRDGSWVRQLVPVALLPGDSIAIDQRQGRGAHPIDRQAPVLPHQQCQQDASDDSRRYRPKLCGEDPGKCRGDQRGASCQAEIADPAALLFEEVGVVLPALGALGIPLLDIGRSDEIVRSIDQWYCSEVSRASPFGRSAYG
jgi:hypothetical protein